MERETGIEPAAPTMARSCSTTELLPQKSKYRHFQNSSSEKQNAHSNHFFLQNQEFLQNFIKFFYFQKILADLKSAQSLK